jgi:tetratricopeptide (TPR) repeat protein
MKATSRSFRPRARDQPVGADLTAPFKIGTQKLMADPKNAFGRAEGIILGMSIEHATQDLWREGAVRMTIRGASGKPESRKSFEYKLRDFPSGPEIPIVITLAARDFPPEYYEAEATLVDGKGNPLFFGKSRFIVSPTEKLGHPIPRTRTVPPESRYQFFGMLAQQSAKLNADAKAESYYRQALALKPDFTRGWAEYAAFLLKAGRFESCLEAADRFKGDGALKFEYLAVRGKALLGLGRAAEAVAALLEANAIYNSDTGVLNALGQSYHRLGKAKEALATLRASLKLNPDQAYVKKLVAEIEATLK